MALPGSSTGLEALSEDKLYTTGHMLTMRARSLLRDAASFFVGHTRAVGVLFIDGNLKNPMFLRSGHEGGPWGGSHRGGIPRLPGWGFTMGAAHEGNISTHVEGHASAILWQRNIKLGYLLVDRAMCKVCDRYLYTTLPPNSTLLVYSEDEGKTVVSASHGS